MALERVNVTVVTYNRPELTLRCLDSLRRVTARPMTLTVVDNASEAPLQAELIALFRNGGIDRLVLNKRNMGVSVAANLGWALTPSPWYCKVDNDIIARDPNWLDALVSLADEGHFAMSAYKLCPWHETHPASLPSGLAFEATGACGGGCVLIPRAAHEKLGFWNEDYRYGWEDLEYGNRAVQAGFSLAYTADASLVEHAGPAVDNTLAAYQQAKLGCAQADSGPLGLFLQNMVMFELGVRPLFVTRRYSAALREENGVTVAEYTPDPAYETVRVRQKLFRERFIKGHDSGILYLDIPGIASKVKNFDKH